MELAFIFNFSDIIKYNFNSIYIHLNLSEKFAETKQR